MPGGGGPGSRAMPCARPGCHACGSIRSGSNCWSGSGNVSPPWSTPRAALQEHAAGGEIHLPPPTQHTLHRFAGLGTSSRQVLGALALAGPGPRIQPHHVKEPPDGPAIVLPDDPAHPDHEAWIAQYAKPARRHRFALVAGRFVYQD